MWGSCGALRGRGTEALPAPSDDVTDPSGSLRSRRGFSTSRLRPRPLTEAPPPVEERAASNRIKLGVYWLIFSLRNVFFALIRSGRCHSLLAARYTCPVCDWSTGLSILSAPALLAWHRALIGLPREPIQCRERCRPPRLRHSPIADCPAAPSLLFGPSVRQLPYKFSNELRARAGQEALSFHSPRRTPLTISSALLFPLPFPITARHPVPASCPVGQSQASPSAPSFPIGSMRRQSLSSLPTSRAMPQLAALRCRSDPSRLSHWLRAAEGRAFGAPGVPRALCGERGLLPQRRRRRHRPSNLH